MKKAYFVFLLMCIFLVAAAIALPEGLLFGKQKGIIGREKRLEVSAIQLRTESLSLVEKMRLLSREEAQFLSIGGSMDPQQTWPSEEMEKLFWEELDKLHSLGAIPPEFYIAFHGGDVYFQPFPLLLYSDGTFMEFYNVFSGNNSAVALFDPEIGKILRVSSRENSTACLDGELSRHYEMGASLWELRFAGWSEYLNLGLFEIDTSAPKCTQDGTPVLTCCKLIDDEEQIIYFGIYYKEVFDNFVMEPYEPMYNDIKEDEAAG